MSCLWLWFCDPWNKKEDAFNFYLWFIGCTVQCNKKRFICIHLIIIGNDFYMMKKKEFITSKFDTMDIIWQLYLTPCSIQLWACHEHGVLFFYHFYSMKGTLKKTKNCEILRSLYKWNWAQCSYTYADCWKKSNLHVDVDIK